MDLLSAQLANMHITSEEEIERSELESVATREDGSASEKGKNLEAEIVSEEVSEVKEKETSEYLLFKLTRIIEQFSMIVLFYYTVLVYAGKLKLHQQFSLFWLFCQIERAGGNCKEKNYH